MLNISQPFLNGLYNLLVVNLASDPFEWVGIFVLRFYCELDFPEGLRNELFDLLSLVNTETQSRSLARAVGNCPIFSTTAPNQLGKLFGLVATEGHS